MKRSFSILLLLMFACMLCFNNSCGDGSVPESDKVQQQATEKAMQEANRQAGMPAIKNWWEKKQLKMLYEKRDDPKLICYAYIITAHGQKIYLGKCIGFGLNASVQFSNPEKVVYEGGYGESFGSMPQPEPNGLFMPEGLSATYIMLINPKSGEPEPVYIENEIIVSPFPLPGFS